MGQLVVSAASLIVAFCALVVIVAGLRRKTDEDRTDALEKRLRDAEVELNECKKARREMRDSLQAERDRNYKLAIENYELMRKAGNAP